MNYGYIRVSSEKQTVENQRYEITEYCKRKGLIIDKWIEESVSGARHPNVRKLGKILNTIDQGDTIYVTELSRLGRCAYMVIAIISHCLIAKANIVEIRDDKLIKDDSDSVQDTFLKVLFAQREREDISRRTKEGLARRVAEGQKLGRHKGGHNSHYKLTGKEALIRTMLDYGYSKAAICRKLKCNPKTLDDHLRRMSKK
jgi:DNA invertase Pin-like site-specific DNA recombinase